MSVQPFDPTPASDHTPPLVVADLSARCMGDAAVAISILHKFEQQIRKEAAEFDRHLAERKAAEIAARAHALKSTAAAAAAPGLQAIARVIEELARGGQLDTMENELAKLRREVEACLDYLPTARKSLLSSVLGASAGLEARS